MKNETILRLRVEKQYGRTVVADCFYTTPLKIGEPNEEGTTKKIVLMMASAGVLKGDQFNYDICCGKDTRTELAEQSYTKLFDTQDGSAVKQVKISVGEGAVLHYHPSPVIPFQNSVFSSKTQIDLKRSSTFLYSEVMSVGRIAMGEQFAFQSYTNKILVRIEGQPVYLEHNHYQPGQQDLRSFVYFDGYTHQGSLYCYLPEKEKLHEFMEKIPEMIETYLIRYSLEEKELMFGVTAAKEGCVLRALGRSAQVLEEVFGLFF